MDFLHWDYYLKFSLYRISFYSGFSLNRFHCIIYIWVQCTIQYNLGHAWYPAVTLLNQFYRWLSNIFLPCYNAVEKVTLLLSLVTLFSMCHPSVPFMCKWNSSLWLTSSGCAFYRKKPCIIHRNLPCKGIFRYVGVDYILR